MSKVGLTRIFWIGAAAILVAAALVAIGALLRGRFGDTDWKILVTLLALLDRGRHGGRQASRSSSEVCSPSAGWVVVGTATVGFVIVAVATWDGYDSDTLARWAGTAAVVVPAVLVVTHAAAAAQGPAPAVLVYGSAAGARPGSADHDDRHLARRLRRRRLEGCGGAVDPRCARLAAGPRAAAPRRSDGRPPAGIVEHVIANLDGVEVVVNGDPAAGSLVIESAGGELVVRNPAGAIQLRPGERLVLRKRTTG